MFTKRMLDLVADLEEELAGDQIGSLYPILKTGSPVNRFINGFAHLIADYLGNFRADLFAELQVLRKLGTLGQSCRLALNPRHEEPLPARLGNFDKSVFSRCSLK